MNTSAPRLRAHAQPFVRNDGTIQFGLESGEGMRLAGLTEAEVAWVVDIAAGGPSTQPRIAPDREHAILSLLGDAGLVAGDYEPDAPGRRRFAGLHLDREARSAGPPDAHGSAYAAVLARPRATIWVLGRGEPAATLSDVLRQAGVGHVVRAPDTAGTPEPPPRRAPQLVILIRASPPSKAHGRPWRARGIPLLPVTVTATHASVGPLIEPEGAPCLHCLDLVRAELDPSWWLLRAQARDTDETVCRSPEVEVALGTLVAGLVARVALAHLDGLPIEPGLALDLTLPWPELTQRRWPRHPDCECGAPRSTAAGTMAG